MQSLRSARGRIVTSSVGKAVHAGKVLEVEVPPRSLDLLAPFVSKNRRSAIAEAAQTVSQALQGRTVININSTARGGGVAELVQGYAATQRAQASIHAGSSSRATVNSFA